MIEGLDQVYQIALYIGTVVGSLMSLVGLYVALKKWVKNNGHCCAENGCGYKLKRMMRDENEKLEKRLIKMYLSGKVKL